MRSNEMSVKGYIFESLFWIIVAYVWYRNLLFLRVFALDDLKSKMILIGIVLAVFVLNICISGKYSRNTRSIWMTTILSFGIYAFLSYVNYMKKPYTWIIVIGMGLTVFYLLGLFARKVKSNQNKRRIMQIRRRRGYIAIRNIGAFVSMAVMISAYVQINVRGGLVTPGEVESTAIYGDEHSLNENIDMFLLLKPDKWVETDASKRMDVLQTVINCEGRYLSFSKKVTLHVAELDAGVLGYYNHDDSTIYIDIYHLLNGSSEECLDTILHECFHCAQHEYADIYRSLDISDRKSYFMLDAARYAEEISNYVNGSKNYHEYYSQSLEADARAYAITASSIIFNRIDEHS